MTLKLIKWLSKSHGFALCLLLNLIFFYEYYGSKILTPIIPVKVLFVFFFIFKRSKVATFLVVKVKYLICYLVLLEIIINVVQKRFFHNSLQLEVILISSISLKGIIFKFFKRSFLSMLQCTFLCTFKYSFSLRFFLIATVINHWLI